ncbi:hypothetical protein CORC01_11952 [Colletotrichum orchidophilum]|uniref:BZIP transcription factor n=1 Tax=Colletotrichum orchidophilum TaxID=1209926 RepID=A0A1G4AUB2_9PEZI|nr:uncharacterized protein CORC01_11952 [Colletotrichum orchidophilum]OHE92734.1 hypothetical protein CORC01_11952 [Colletotrichum orchidophilum]
MASHGLDDDAPTPAASGGGGGGGPSAKVPSEKELARKIRKRELDRRAQRQARERTRNRIAELEAQVKELRKDDSTRLSAAMEQLAAVTRERDGLFDTFKSIEQTMRDRVLPSRPAPAATRQRSPTPPTLLTTSTSLPPAAAAAASRNVTMLTELSAPSYTAPMGLLSDTPAALEVHGFHGRVDGAAGGVVVGRVPSGFPASSVHAPSIHASSSTSDSQDFIEDEVNDGDDVPDDPNLIVPPPEAPCDCVTARTPAGPAPPRVNVWRAVNQILAKRCHISKEAHIAEDANDEDIPVRVLLEGWDAVATSRPLSKLWRKLRRVDELCFQTCPPTERLAILRTMHLLLQYHSDPTPERYVKLPTWYLKRPSQAMPHSYAIDFFVWPGVRERFVFGQHHYCNNQFWELFSTNFHLLWPFEFRDAYKKSVITGQYQMSPMFEQRISDINAWTMGMDFFNQFPELIADMPAFNSVAQTLTPAVTSPPPTHHQALPRQASLSQLKERDERLLLEHQASAAAEGHQPHQQQANQDGMDCSQAMQVYQPSIYSMAPPGFMDEFIPQGYDAHGPAGTYGSMPGYF